VVVALIAVFLIWLVEKRVAPREDLQSTMSEAFAALVAAFLAAVGSYRGHRRGRDRRDTADAHPDSTLLERSEGIALIVLSVVVLVVAFIVARLLDVSAAAVTAVAGAVVAITLVDALHDMSSRLRDSRRLGMLIVAGALLGGVLLIVARPEEAEAMAAVAAALATVGATQLAHVQGFQAGA
jgi:asparagine N-glycosylation enzyme membrane subunit Stt3